MSQVKGSGRAPDLFLASCRSDWDLGGGDGGGDVLARLRAPLRRQLRLQDHQRAVQQPRVRNANQKPLERTVYKR